MSGLTVPTIALAAQGRYYHFAYAEDGNTYGGGTTQFTTQQLISSDPTSYPSCGHLNHTEWVDTDGNGNGNTVGSDWAEIGYTYGDNFPDGTCGLSPACGSQNYYNCMSYYYYWTNATGNQFLKFFESVPDSDLGGNHVYTIEQCAGCYQIAFDGAIVAYDQGAQGWTDVARVGLESTADGGSLGWTIDSWAHGLRSRACCSWGGWGSSGLQNIGSAHTANWVSQPNSSEVT